MPKDLLFRPLYPQYHDRRMEKLFYTYIVASKSRVLYTGITSSLNYRVWQHKNGAFEGFSKKYKCTRLVWHEQYNTPQRAIAYEKHIKGLLCTKKIGLIESMNPTWEDLATNWYEEHSGKAGPSVAPKGTPLPQDDAS